MFVRLGQFVVRRWPLVILFWLAATVTARLAAPRWDDVARDGDFAYLPAYMKSVVGERLLEKAFPHNRSKSQIVLVTVRENGEMSGGDFFVAYDLTRRFLGIHGAVRVARAQRLHEDIARSAERPHVDIKVLQERLETEFAAAGHALDEAIRLNGVFASKRVSKDYWGDDTLLNAEAHYHRAILRELQGDQAGAEQDQRIAETAGFQPSGDDADGDAFEWPLLDVWTWYEDVFGEKLGHDHAHARLIVLHLSNEFMAVDNIEVLRRLNEQVDAVRQRMKANGYSGLAVEVTGSAAVGGDMLLSAKESIRSTEAFTVLLIVALLVFIYRSPLLVVLPLITIAVSLVVSMGLVASLTMLHDVPGFHWWNLKVFTTTRIFVVVILFGAGTDYCLFLISRYREELSRLGDASQAIVASLGGVGDALAASALTTILGLGMMFFTEFGKFRNSGPVIGLCLFITLAASITLTPALLCAFQPMLAWGRRYWAADKANDGRRPSKDSRFWLWAARVITDRPAIILLASLVAMAPLAWLGWTASGHVSYDFLDSLDRRRPSRVGSDVYRRHFPIGEKSPIVVIAYRPEANFNEGREDRKQIALLTHALYVDGVTSVRSLHDPMGDYPPGRRMTIWTREAWRTRLMRPHQRTEEVYVSRAPGHRGNTTRLEVITKFDPFSRDANDVLGALDDTLQRLAASPGYWRGATFAFAGTTAAISDLREITQSDTDRIQVLVVLAVFVVLVAILRRPLVCLYMVASVLLTYFVTLGSADLFFHWVDGAAYQGLDWKAPLFLFVILVAIGQDYNVYLATRVFEEQERLGPFTGLRRAVTRTGGIITSCGLIMAGAFVAMTSSAWSDLIPHWLMPRWFPVSSEGALKSITQLGFALALGVVLDTFVVRTILLPAFLALLCRWRGRSNWLTHRATRSENSDST